MKYTAHPQGIQDGLPLISIFDKDGLCVATLTMDDIALLYQFIMWNEADYILPDEDYDKARHDLVKKLIKIGERR